jgi:antitoxin (DNA-binding transcriptional repressor) of toxin-antitoxin stability system
MGAEMGIEQARKILGDLVNRADIGGQVTHITRNGRRVAAIAPISRIAKESSVPFTSSDLRTQIKTATDASDGHYDTEAIFEEIVESHGAVDVDAIDSAEFWEIVGKHCTDDTATAVWYVVRGESPDSHAVEPGPAGIEIPREVIDWAEQNGNTEDDPDTYVMATPADEASGAITGQLAAQEFPIAAADLARLRAALAEQDATD